MNKLALIAALISIAALSCDNGNDDDDDTSGWTTATCMEYCEAYYAEELEESEISGVTIQILENGDCQCAFYPCMTDPCSLWCQENEGTESGHCEFLTCVCDE